MKLSDVQQISNADISNMKDIKQLKEIANVLFPAVNKRIQRLEQSDLGETQALRGLKISQGTENPRFIISNSKTEKQLKAQIIAAQNFVKSKTGSVTKAKKLSKDFWKRNGFDKPPMSEKDMWEEFRKFEEGDNGTKFSKAESNFAVSKVRTVWDDSALRKRFLTDNEYRKEILDDIYEYKASLGLEPKQENITEDFKEMT